MKIDAIRHKWGKGHFVHLDVNEDIIIDKWVRNDIPKPTVMEIQQASDDYEQHLIDQPIQDEKDYKKMKTKLKTKLDMDDSQFEIFEKFFKSGRQGN